MINLPKDKNISRTCSDEKLKKVQKSDFEIPQCDSLVEIFTITQLTTFF